MQIEFFFPICIKVVCLQRVVTSSSSLPYCERSQEVWHALLFLSKQIEMGGFFNKDFEFEVIDWLLTFAGFLSIWTLQHQRSQFPLIFSLMARTSANFWLILGTWRFRQRFVKSAWEFYQSNWLLFFLLADKTERDMYVLLVGKWMLH
jgi:hypothetical protein